MHSHYPALILTTCQLYRILYQPPAIRPTAVWTGPSAPNEHKLRQWPLDLSPICILMFFYLLSYMLLANWRIFVQRWSTKFVIKNTYIRFPISCIWSVNEEDQLKINKNYAYLHTFYEKLASLSKLTGIPALSTPLCSLPNSNPEPVDVFHSQIRDN